MGYEIYLRLSDEFYFVYPPAMIINEPRGHSYASSNRRVIPVKRLPDGKWHAAIGYHGPSTELDKEMYEKIEEAYESYLAREVVK